ncbi:unnamed protein product, partial [Polarella glacialis]
LPMSHSVRPTLFCSLEDIIGAIFSNQAGDIFGSFAAGGHAPTMPFQAAQQSRWRRYLGLATLRENQDGLSEDEVSDTEEDSACSHSDL